MNKRQWKIAYWLCQLVGWGVFFGIILFLQLETNFNKYIIVGNVLLLYISSILISDGLRHLLRRFNFENKTLWWNIIRFTPMALAAATILTLIQAGIASLILEAHSEPTNLILNGVGYSILYTCWLAIYLAVTYIQHIQVQRTENLKLKSEKQEIELSMLKSQLNPHFVFNSLNSIRALVIENPKLARDSISRLSDLLRGSLGKLEQRWTLKEEVNFTESYLELEKLRYEERLRIHWEVSTQHLNHEILPFSLQLLVENAIKHSVGKRTEGDDIFIRIFDNDRLIIEVTNSNPGSLSTDSVGGIGLNNLRKRLLLEFEDQASFVIKFDPEKVRTILKYKL